MAYKQFSIDDQTSITIYKKRSSKSLRLSVDSGGNIKVTIPSWAPYASGLTFAKTRLDWIRQQKQPAKTLVHKQIVGKAHRLQFIPNDTEHVKTKIIGNEIRIYHPMSMSSSHIEVQNRAKSACIRALRLQSNQLLPQRIEKIASARGYTYRKVTTKMLKSRWGSCDHKGNIVLNLYLLQLPWELIDYVLIHELVHTKVMKHGPEFWSVMLQELPGLENLKLAIREYKPILDSPDILTVA